MKVLINAYAVCPGMGSEPGMGWNWVSNLARYCECHVITESEFREQIEAAVAQLPWGSNLHFYWNPVSPEVRKMCWNQGDWRFYKYYRQWQKKTVEMASEIVCKEKIDILHQLNMIGFREPGYLWSIPDIPFVWGPIGGLKQFPVAYLKGAGLKMGLFQRLKNLINILQIRFDSRVRKALHRAAVLVSSIPDSYRAIRKYHGLESVVIPETGCFAPVPKVDHGQSDGPLNLVWVGKFDFRKRLDIALRIVARLEGKVRLVVCGSGNEAQVASAKALAVELGIADQVDFLGAVGNDEVHRLMRKSDAFLFTSISEDTSTVVLEAVSNSLPVFCFEACGMAAVIDSQVGRKIPLTNPDRSVEDFVKEISYFEAHRDELLRLSSACLSKAESLSWENKARKMVEIYKSIIK